MTRISHNPGRLSAGTRKPAPRWRRVAAALVLALYLGSAGHTLPAQAAPAGATELKFFMLAVKEGQIHAPLCKDEQVHINVLVYRRKEIDGVDSGIDTLPGISVTGVVDNPNVGKISPNPATTTPAGSIYPGAADFVFTAENYGTTSISFIGLVATPGWFGTNFRSGAEKVTAHVDVTVIPCKEKVKAELEFHTGIYDITVLSDEAVMTRDASGTFTGSTSMYWVYSNYANLGCTLSLSAADSPVDLTGKLDDDGRQFVATATFQPTTVSLTGTCPLASYAGQRQGSVYPLTFSVASSGGVSSQTVKGEGISGIARIVVVPEEDKAAAFNVVKPQAQVGSPPAWMAMLWNEFPNLYGALLALR